MKKSRRTPWDKARTERIRIRLGEPGLAISRKALADRLGVSPASVTYWENGSRTPYAKMRRIIERIEESLDLVDKVRLKSPSKRS